MKYETQKDPKAIKGADSNSRMLIEKLLIWQKQRLVNKPTKMATLFFLQFRITLVDFTYNTFKILTIIFYILSKPDGIFKSMFSVKSNANSQSPNPYLSIICLNAFVIFHLGQFPQDLLSKTI